MLCNMGTHTQILSRVVFVGPQEERRRLDNYKADWSKWQFFFLALCVRACMCECMRVSVCVCVQQFTRPTLCSLIEWTFNASTGKNPGNFFFLASLPGYELLLNRSGLTF